MKFTHYAALNGASAATNQTSGAINATYVVALSAHAIVTGTAIGSLKIQVSNDPLLNVGQNGIPTVTNWVDLPSATVAISGPGNFLIPKVDFSYMWMRVVFTFTSGTGTITVNIKTDAF